MVYTPAYCWYVILGLSLTPKQGEVLEVQFCNWCEKWEKVALREISDIGLWIQNGQTWKIWPWHPLILYYYKIPTKVKMKAW